jgi:signal transduction histidine kinase
MSEQLHFRVSSALKDIIGRDLITDDYIAVFELVKNAYDAYATVVDIIFKNLNSSDAEIIIKDNGKGMTYDDIINKWLFVAYSAKREGTEDKDYRDKIFKHRLFAGAKGIGRFSCDRLGKVLELETTSRNEETTHILHTEWEKFEESMQDEFINIKVNYEKKEKQIELVPSGTSLRILELRDEWDREKIVNLKNSLAKLINPDSDINEQAEFGINIIAEDEINADSGFTEYYQIVNGPVKNFIFENLNFKTTKISAAISEDGNFISTELKDGGTLIYKIKENNPYSRLKKIRFTLYYLNTSAKNNFTRYMGVRAVDFGSVFLYKNGFRIYPFGEVGEDTLGIDSRKQQGYARFLGTREIIGRIEINDIDEVFKETSSRDGGLIRTDAYDELVNCFFEIVLKRLERFVVDIQQWGLSLEDEEISLNDANLMKTKSIELIAKLTNSDSIVDIEYNNNFLDILEYSQESSASALLKNIKRIANESNREELFVEAKKVEDRLRELQSAKDEAEMQAEKEKKIAAKATKDLEVVTTENLFLKSIKGQEFDEIISFVHHMGISASIIDNYLVGLYKMVENQQSLKAEEVIEIFRLLIFENKKILNISKFATKANFKLTTDAMELNLDEYIKEYIGNVVGASTRKDFAITFSNNNHKPLIFKFRPIELNILIDNLISNSKKAQANKFDISIDRNVKDEYQISFADNGIGIPTEALNKVFDFGYTTTSGSGIGLFHIKQIVEKMNGKIEVESKLDSGTTFKITLK